MLLTGAVSVLPPATVRVAVGAPVKMTLLAVADEIVVVEPNVNVTVAELVPKIKSVVEVEIDAPDVVMRFVPDSGPTIDTPNPAEDVMVDETTVRPVPDPAPR